LRAAANQPGKFAALLKCCQDGPPLYRTTLQRRNAIRGNGRKAGGRARSAVDLFAAA
jgi:hypothetical protein